MKDENNSLFKFCLILLIFFILISSSILRTNDSYNKVSDIAHWFSKNPQTKKFSMFPFNIRLCSASGESITFKRSMIFEIEKKDTKWKLSQRAAFEFHDGIISFLWHKKYNFDEENIPFPDVGRFWKSSSNNYFLRYFGNTYSTTSCE